MATTYVAAIDIGTVTCRLLLAGIDETGLHELHREAVITNLGIGVDASGMLRADAMERVREQMVRFRSIIAAHEEETGAQVKVVAIATSASRDAKNASEFASMLAAEGIQLSVIPGEREAALSFRGASHEFAGEKLLVVDIGGGSTEIIAGEGACVPLFKHSFNIGCRRVTEMFLHEDPPSVAELTAARNWVRAEMEAKFAELRATGFEPARMVAVAGTATSVVSVNKHMEVYDSARVHRSVIDTDTFASVYEQMRSVPLEERRGIVGLDPRRADVIVAGMLILQVVMELAGVLSFTVSESDILQGIILDSAER